MTRTAPKIAADGQPIVEVAVPDGQPLVEVARAAPDGQPLVEYAADSFDFAEGQTYPDRIMTTTRVADIDGVGPTGEGMEEWEFATSGGRTVGAGQVTEILERQADDGGGFIIIDIIDDLRVADGGFVFGQTMYMEV